MDDWLVCQQAVGETLLPSMITIRSAEFFVVEGGADSMDCFEKTLATMLLGIESQVERCGKRVLTHEFKQVTWINKFDRCAYRCHRLLPP